MKRNPWPYVVEYIAILIGELRLARGWDQADLARRARISRAAVARLEQGTSALVPLRNLWAVAQALGCGVDELLPPRRKR